MSAVTLKRTDDMVNQRNVDKVREDFLTDWETAAKLRTVVKGKVMPATEFKGRKTRKSSRQMSVGYYINTIVKDSVKDVTADAESLKWVCEARKKAVQIRARQDERVRNGANRKPKSEWLKPGRVAGKVYPKYEEAMKRVAAAKRLAAKKRKARNQPK